MDELPPKQNLSPDVKACQVGYLPGETKFAVLTARPAGEVVVRDAATGEIALTATVGDEAFDEDSGDTTWRVEFTELRQSGAYFVDAPGLGSSHDFRIDDDIFIRPFRLAMRSYYSQRCGTAVDLGPEFPEYKHTACHTGIAHFHSSAGRSGEHESHGGWHDAGDYGRYIVNSGITTATLLWAYELYAPKLNSFDLSIPESGSAAPDVLSEIRYNIDWMLTLQDELDGGVWHKATSARFCPFIMPEDDQLPVLIIGSGNAPFKTTASTADFAAVCATAARVYLPFDRAFSARCLLAATRAWDWLTRNPDDHIFDNPDGIRTGGYGDHDVRDERLWAAAELFRTTGEPRYNDYFVAHYAQWSPAISADHAQTWSNVAQMAMYTYLLGARDGSNLDVLVELHSDAVRAADTLVERAAANAYLVPMRAADYVWGSNSVVSNYAMMLLIANRIAPNKDYVDTAQNCLHYLLGRNTFNTSFLTHVGSQWAMHPHHRPSGADGIEQPWPGLLVGGPNGRRHPNPARQWRDEEPEFTMNETAINWNAPLVFQLAEALP